MYIYCIICIKYFSTVASQKKQMKKVATKLMSELSSEEKLLQSMNLLATPPPPSCHEAELFVGSGIGEGKAKEEVRRVLVLVIARAISSATANKLKSNS